MKHFKQYKPLVIEELSADSFHYPPHHQTYYELVYIKKGRGVSHINTSYLPYQQGDLFFVSPEDNHYFEVQEYTTFVFVKFTNEYIKKYHSNHLPWQSQVFNPLLLFKNVYLKEQGLKLKLEDQQRIKNAITDMLQYNVSEHGLHSWVVYFQLQVILSTIHESLESISKTKLINETNDIQVINYIHQYIYNPDRLRISQVAEHFNISEQYFSAWFKQIYQISYKSYIDHYRIEHLKNRLLHSSAPIQAIADEFGFSDSSHFSNYFFKHTKIRPATYRKNALKLK